MGKFNVGDRVQIPRLSATAVGRVNLTPDQPNGYYRVAFDNKMDGYWFAEMLVPAAPELLPTFHVDTATLTPQQAVNLASKLLQFATQARE